MARVSTKTRDGIEVVRRTGPDGRPIIESFHARLYEQLAEAGLVQIRVLAEESREMILDKLYEGNVRPPGQASVPRPPRMRRSDIPTSERKPFKLRALADTTVKKKAAAGRDGRRLIESGEYTYGIEVFRGTKNGVPYYIVRPKPGKHSEAGVTHRVLAAFHELGTRTTPKRPHWGPVLRVMKRTLMERGPDVKAAALRAAVRGVK